MTAPVDGDGVRLRRAGPADVQFLAELERDAAEPAASGRFVIEALGGDETQPVGSIAFTTTNRRSRIAHLYGLMLSPDARGRGLARAATIRFAEHLLTDLDFHRIELECYGYNERGIAHFEACGFVREGVRRRAYARHGGWVDGVCFGLLAEDLPAGRR